MNTRYEQLCLSHISQLGLRPAERHELKKNGLGFTFVPKEGVGTGSLWSYPISSSCLLTISDLRFHQSVTVVHNQMPLLALTLQRTADGREHLRGHCLSDQAFAAEFRPETPIQCIGLRILPEFCEQQLPRLVGYTVSELPDVIRRLDGTASIPEAEDLMARLARINPATGTASLRYSAMILELTAILLEWNARTGNPAAEKPVPDRDREAIGNLRCFLTQHYATQLDLNELARMCSMSKSKLTSLFRKVCGSSIYDFVLACRMERAKELLADRQKRISEIAVLVGYERESSFSAVFHQKTGMTPNEYRKTL